MQQSIPYLGERQWVELVLGRNLEAAGLLGVDVVAGLGSELDRGVDALVVAGGDDAQVLGANDAGSVVWSLVAETEAVPGDSGLLDIVTSLTTNKEAIRASGHIHNGVDVALSSSVVEESAAVDVWVLEGQVELLSGRTGLGWVPEVLKVDLDAIGHNIVELDLAVKQGCGGPCLGDRDTFIVPKCQRIDCSCALAVRHAARHKKETCSQW